MTRNKPWTAVSKALVGVTTMLIVTLVLASGTAAAGTYKPLHSFTWAKNPNGNLILDAAGNLYGTTYNGGGHDLGAVFKLEPNPDGPWTVSILHSFAGTDGANPAAGLVFDAAGNLYGTTQSGGLTGDCQGPNGGGPNSCGVVFKLTPNADGTWTESVLYSFMGIPDAANPVGGLIFDAAGNLYGTTSAGGGGVGTVFKLTPSAGGTWTESVLHSFGGGWDGGYPYAGLIFDTAGNLYGTSFYGGDTRVVACGCGVVWKLEPNPEGTWTMSALFSFMGEDGALPYAGLIFDAAGNLYGTTEEGGYLSVCPVNADRIIGGCGVVFKLTPTSSGWSETVLLAFLGKPGEYPYAGVIMDAAGNLYGTTYGQNTNYGSVFELTHTSTGWSDTVLHKFTGTGEYPIAGLTMDAAGNLYGTTSAGTDNYGLVFEITP